MTTQVIAYISSPSNMDSEILLDDFLTAQNEGELLEEELSPISSEPVALSVEYQAFVLMLIGIIIGILLIGKWR